MTPYNAAEERHQSHERRLADLEAGPYLCTECGTPYNSPLVAERCATDDLTPEEPC